VVELGTKAKKKGVPGKARKGLNTYYLKNPNFVAAVEKRAFLRRFCAASTPSWGGLAFSPGGNFRDGPARPRRKQERTGLFFSSSPWSAGDDTARASGVPGRLEMKTR